MDVTSGSARPAGWFLVGLLLAAAPTAALARSNVPHRHVWVHRDRAPAADSDTNGGTYPITAGQSDIRINSVGEVITSRHP